MKMVLVLSPSDLQEEASRQIVNGVRHGNALVGFFFRNGHSGFHSVDKLLYTCVVMVCVCV